ncbi:MAG: 1-(5-phosphoribosyl)-5-[(5-phosphoribosylamino)methylideneamino]imidazole-4-carboxamide isomerase [candidate division NC10 bacterium]|jgi:phosphoribosylformimino-5-aminoimidazole carboxamide ribotide isomerase|nr:1-(5-phosphoribosyl)-5-[(5-phosphoribosylamino)methylideneamino]imidazole-4-carboxamide isomerase [candidate division NC10 bacterium]
MLIIPAIDIKDGRAVRLTQGDPARETVYAEDPVTVAKAWEEKGAPRLHVVDLDGAFAGTPKQGSVIGAVARAVRIPVQAGGGLRTPETVEAAFEAGVAMAVVGTSAILDPDFLDRLSAAFPRRIILALDARDGKVAVKGWRELSDHAVDEVVERVAALELAAILYTDIVKDGTLGGPNFAGVEAITRQSRHPVFASGGIASVEDIRRLRGIRGVAGAILGKALYSGAIDLETALRVAAGETGRRC